MIKECRDNNLCNVKRVDQFTMYGACIYIPLNVRTFEKIGRIYFADDNSNVPICCFFDKSRIFNRCLYEIDTARLSSEYLN